MKFSVLLPLGAALSFFCRFGFCSECIASDSRFELPPIGFSDTFRAKAETIVDESARFGKKARLALADMGLCEKGR